MEWWSDHRKIETPAKESENQLVTRTTKNAGRIYELIYPEKVLSRPVARGENISCTASNNPDIDPLIVTVRLVQVGGERRNFFN